MDIQSQSQLQEQLQEQLNKEKIKDKPQAARATRSVISRPDDVEEQVWDDFLATRKANKAPVTQTALDGIRREAQKAGLTLEAALQTMCERGWRGFRADWMQTTVNVASKSQSIGKSMGSAADEIVGQIFGDVVEGDCFFIDDTLGIEKNGNA